MNPEYEADSHLRMTSSGCQIAEADLERVKGRLRAFVFSLLPNRQACEEVVQDTLLFLWEKRDEKRPDSNVKAWAFKVARFKVLSWRRDRAREQVVRFSDDMLLELAAEADQISDEYQRRIQALESCLGRLADEDKTLLRVRYTNGATLTDLSKIRGENPNRLHKQISRLRIALKQCVEKQLSHFK